MKVIRMGFILLIFLLNSVTFSQSGWFQQTSGTSLPLKDIFMLDPWTGWCVGFGGKILKTTNGGEPWFSQLTGLNEFFISVRFVNLTTGFAGTVGGLLYKTFNGGTTWNPVNIGITASIDGIFFININSSTGWFVANNGTGYIFKTTNSGSNWFIQRVTPFTQYRSCHFINTNTGWVCGDSILKTTNGGNNWQVILNSPPSVSIQFRDSSLGYTVGGSVYKTTNGGLNWLVKSTNGGFDLFFISSMTGWVCGNLGEVYMTTNGGDNWNLQNTGIGDPINSIWFANQYTGYAVTDYGKILKTTTSGITGFEPINNHVPVNFNLYQNYPNPFNPSTKIRFDIPAKVKNHASNIKLIIYDLLGREVTTLVNEELKPGTYEISWDASNFPSGVYFYKIITDGYIETNKMVLLK